MSIWVGINVHPGLKTFNGENYRPLTLYTMVEVYNYMI